MLERGEGRKGGGEKHTPTGDWTCNQGIEPATFWFVGWQPPTKPHQPGLDQMVLMLPGNG